MVVGNVGDTVIIEILQRRLWYIRWRDHDKGCSSCMVVAETKESAEAYVNATFDFDHIETIEQQGWVAVIPVAERKH